MARTIGVSIAKIAAFLGACIALMSAATLGVVALGGRDFFFVTPYRVALEVLLTMAVMSALIVSARFIDKRSLWTIGFAPKRLFDLLTGTVLGAAIFAAPLALLVAMGAARFEPDLGGFTAQA